MRVGKSVPLIVGLIIVWIIFSTLCSFGQTKSAGDKPAIKIGYIAAFTAGPYAGPSIDMRDGFLLYLGQKGNQFAGRHLELLQEDTEAKPDVGLVKVKKLVERDNVHMLAGVFHSGVAYAIADFVKGQRIPLLIQMAGADDLTQRRFSPYIFRCSFTNSQWTHPLGEWAYARGFRKLAIVSSDYAAGWEFSGGFARTFTEKGGRVVQELYYPLGTADPGPFITAIKPEVDIVYSFHAGADALRYVRRYDEYGLKKRAALFGPGALVEDSILPEQGDSALGVITSGNYTSVLDNPANKAFITAVLKEYKRPATNYYTVNGYVGAMMLEKALESVGGNIEDRENFVKALEKVEIPDTPRGPVKFDKYHNVVNNVYICEVKKIDGRLVNALIQTYKGVSQFWKWTPEEYMKMPTYTNMRGKWVK